jgi:RNA polymerase sigma-70 factor, ECF subfamily
MFDSVSAAVTAKRTPEAPASTLGDLLHDDAIPERDWERLVRAIAAGDQQALRALYERSNRLVFTLAVRICGNRELAEEVTLDTFHDVWRRAGEYERRGSVVAWIMTMARSRAIDRLRFEQRKKRVPVAGDDAEESSSAGSINSRHRQQSIHNALTTLTVDERQAIETAFFSELTYAETALRLDQPLGTVKTRVRSALAKLRKAIEGEEP